MDKNFKVKTSERKFRHGLIFGLANYAPTTIYRWLFKKFDKFQFFSPKRKEEPSLIFKISVLTTLFLSIFTLYLLNPKIVSGKSFIKKEFKQIANFEKKF